MSINTDGQEETYIYHTLRKIKLNEQLPILQDPYASLVQWTTCTDKFMSLGDQNKHQDIQRSAYPFENTCIKIKKAWGSGRGSIQE